MIYLKKNYLCEQNRNMVVIDQSVFLKKNIQDSETVIWWSLTQVSDQTSASGSLGFIAFFPSTMFTRYRETDLYIRCSRRPSY